LRHALSYVTPETKNIDSLYHIGCDCGECTALADDGQTVRFGRSFDGLLQQALQNIYEKQSGRGRIEIPPSLFALNNRPLQTAAGRTFQNFGAEFGKRNERFISQFKDNTAIFAAFKSHSEAEILSKLIRTENGELRSFYEFRKVAAPVVGKYNRTWLQTEYNMVVRSARMGAQWQTFEEKKHIFPNIEYMRTSSLNPRPEHESFAGTILPVDHPWWDTHTPPLSWNCKCSIRQTRREATDLPPGEEPVSPVFQNNPGKTAQAVTDKHPYFPEGCASCPLPGERVIVSPELAAGQRKDCYNCLKAMKAAEVKTAQARKREKLEDSMLPLLKKNVIRAVAADKQIKITFKKSGNSHIVNDVLEKNIKLSGTELAKIDDLIREAEYVRSSDLYKDRSDNIQRFYYFKDKKRNIYYNVAEEVVKNKNGRVYLNRFIYSTTGKIPFKKHKNRKAAT
jgi:hypothetical protein